MVPEGEGPGNLLPLPWVLGDRASLSLRQSGGPIAGHLPCSAFASAASPLPKSAFCNGLISVRSVQPPLGLFVFAGNLHCLSPLPQTSRPGLVDSLSLRCKLTHG